MFLRRGIIVPPENPQTEGPYIVGYFLLLLLLILLLLLLLLPFVLGPPVCFPSEFIWMCGSWRQSVWHRTCDQPCREAATTQDNINTEETGTGIHASSGIRTHDPSIWAGENVSCLGRRGHCDQRRLSVTPCLADSQVLFVPGGSCTRYFIADNHLRFISYKCVFKIQNSFLCTNIDSFRCYGEWVDAARCIVCSRRGG
jgi:hypothetical protein